MWNWLNQRLFPHLCVFVELKLDVLAPMPSIDNKQILWSLCNFGGDSSQFLAGASILLSGAALIWCAVFIYVFLHSIVWCCICNAICMEWGSYLTSLSCCSYVPLAWSCPFMFVVPLHLDLIVYLFRWRSLLTISLSYMYDYTHGITSSE